jgi:hypothetical protein
MSTTRSPRATLAAALKLHAAGYWAVPIMPGQKRPIGKDWGTDRQDLDRLHDAFRKNPDAGIGIALGPGRAPAGSWLIDVEGDGPAAAESLARLLAGDVRDTPSWSSTRGNHTLFVADGPRLLELLNKAGAGERTGAQAGVYKVPELPDLEFRIGGTKPDGSTKQLQSVAPPTPGTDGKPRAWTATPRTPVAPLPNAAYDLLDRLAEARQASQASQAASKPMPTPPPHTADDRRGPPRTRPTAEERAAKYLETIEPAIAGNQGHAKTFAAACRIGPGFNLPPDIALDLLKRHYNPHCRPPWSDAELAHKVDEAYKVESERGWLLRTRPAAQTQKPRTSGTDDTDRRPAVELTVERHIVGDQALRALEADPDLYRRGDTLGTAYVEPQDLAQLPHGIQLRQARGANRFMPISDANLGMRLTATATFYTTKTDRHGEVFTVDSHPPEWLIRAINTRGHWPKIRPLETICSTPYVRTDGTLPDPGYDGTTGALYSPCGPIQPPAGHPTAADARDAAHQLYALVCQFPFASGYDYATWLAGLLTAIQRPTIAGAVPGIAVIGNRAGVGKGLLIDLVGALVWGHPIPTRSYPIDQVEAAKVKLSIALSGIGAVHFDNLIEGGYYGGGELDSALTSTEVSGRILGQSRESGPVPLRPCWWLSGNNISPATDSYRRWLVCNLATPLESPHERTDLRQTNLKAWAIEHRAEPLQHALTILRAHALAGRPTGDWGPLGSYEEWDRTVRGAVWMATGNDCLTTQRQAAQEMPGRAEKLALLEGWSELPGGTENGLTVDEAMALVDSQPTMYPMLHSAFMRMARDGKTPTIRQIGNKIRAMCGQNIGGHKFAKCGEKAHYAIWRVVNG